MYCNYQTDSQYRTQDINSPFTASYVFKPFPPVQDISNLEKFEDVDGNLDPIMEEKLEIIDSRPNRKKGCKKVKSKRLPGQKLIKKIQKNEQLTKSLERVVKTIVK